MKKGIDEIPVLEGELWRRLLSFHMVAHWLTESLCRPTCSRCRDMKRECVWPKLYKR